MGAAEFKDLVLDAIDHQALADWWCEAMGYARRPPPAGVETPLPEWPVPIHDPLGQGPLVWINPVAETKSVSNRLRLDVRGDAQELLALGATLVRRRDVDQPWDVLADPEGNEFGVFPRNVSDRPVVRLRPR